MCTVHKTVHRLSCYMNIPKNSKLFIQIVRETSVRETSVRESDCPGNVRYLTGRCRWLALRVGLQLAQGPHSRRGRTSTTDATAWTRSHRRAARLQSGAARHRSATVILTATGLKRVFRCAENRDWKLIFISRGHVWRDWQWRKISFI